MFLIVNKNLPPTRFVFGGKLLPSTNLNAPLSNVPLISLTFASPYYLVHFIMSPGDTASAMKTSDDELVLNCENNLFGAGTSSVISSLRAGMIVLCLVCRYCVHRRSTHSCSLFQPALLQIATYAVIRYRRTFYRHFWVRNGLPVECYASLPV